MYKFTIVKHGSRKGTKYSFKIISNEFFGCYQEYSFYHFLLKVNITKKYAYDYIEDNFNSILPLQEMKYSARIFFKNKKDCKRTIEWLEGLIVMQALIGEKT